MKTGIRCDEYQKFENEYQASKSYLWGVSSGSAKDITHIEMTVKAAEGEEFIVRRLEREKEMAVSIRSQTSNTSMLLIHTMRWN